MLDEKIKTYEDYFDALDRLEEKRDTEQTREDIVKQLQRLEGATDEASRQKAKDLRKDLINLDEDAADTLREQSRDDLLDRLEFEKTEYEAI